MLLLAALAQEHILYIGPPGTAKSELGRRLSRLCKGNFFERLLTRFSVPEVTYLPCPLYLARKLMSIPVCLTLCQDSANECNSWLATYIADANVPDCHFLQELFGPLSMRALEDDKYVRQTEGYLPKANVAFIDKIFKANSAILNTLLTVLNERLFDNGTSREQVPLLCMVRLLKAEVACCCGHADCCLLCCCTHCRSGTLHARMLRWSVPFVTLKLVHIAFVMNLAY